MSRPIIKDNLKILDALRGIAAIYVLIHHCRWLLWEGYAEGYQHHPETYSALQKGLMYFFTAFKFGNEAVLFFFVLSGFVIHWSVSGRLEKEGRFNTGDYLLKRTKRIYPPLLIAIAFTFIVDSIGMNMHLPLYFSQTPYASINNNIKPSLSFTTLLGNLFFVQKIYTPVWGTNGSLWSLMYEWWFYMLYIPLQFFFRKNKLATIGAVIVLWWFSIAYGFILPKLVQTVLNYFIIWFSGMLLADMLRYKTIKPVMGILYLAVILGCFASTTLLPFLPKPATADVASAGFAAESINAGHMMLTVLICLAIYAMLTTNIFSFMKRLHKCSSYSYTLYAMHLPLICLFSGLLMKASGGYLPAHFGFIFIAVPIAIAIAWVLHLAGERPFTKK